MRTSKTLIGIGAIATILAAYFYSENKKHKREIKDLEIDKLRIILDSVQRNQNLSSEIKRQLKELILKFENIDSNVYRELAEALQLLQLNQIENAITALVKIIERLLTLHYKNSSDFKNWLKQKKTKKSLQNLLTFCKEEKKISKTEYHFFVSIIDVRNAKTHEAGFKQDNYLNVSSLIIGIGGIYKIARITYPKPYSYLD